MNGLSLCIGMHNCNGWNNGEVLVPELLQYCDIYFFNSIGLVNVKVTLIVKFDGFLSMSVSGIDDSEITITHSGCVVIYTQELAGEIKQINYLILHN